MNSNQSFLQKHNISHVSSLDLNQLIPANQPKNKILKDSGSQPFNPLNSNHSAFQTINSKSSMPNIIHGSIQPSIRQPKPRPRTRVQFKRLQPSPNIEESIGQAYPKQHVSLTQLQQLMPQLQFVNAYQKKCTKLSDFLHFNQRLKEKESMNDEQQKLRSKHKAMSQIQKMYLRDVPAYLVEDHPLEFPDAAKRLIKKAASSKGNGKTAEQLDSDLMLLYKEEQKNQKKRTKMHSKTSKMANHDYELIK